MLVVIVLFHHNCKKAHTRTTKKQPPQWPSAEEKMTLSPRRKPVARQPPPIQRKPHRTPRVLQTNKKEISQTKTSIGTQKAQSNGTGDD